VFDRYNEAARRAMFFSRYEASLLGQPLIDSEHILLGLLRDQNEIIRELLEVFHVDPFKIRAAFPIPDPPPAVSSSAALPLSENAKRILAFTATEADKSGTSTIGPEMLLLGILSLPGSRAAKLLAEFGMTYEGVADIYETLAREVAIRAEKRERTPIVLRDSHYELLDLISENMPVPVARRASRQQLVLAILDALAASSIRDTSFRSVEEFTNAIKDELLRRWPGA